MIAERISPFETPVVLGRFAEKVTGKSFWRRQSLAEECTETVVSDTLWRATITFEAGMNELERMIDDRYVVAVSNH